MSLCGKKVYAYKTYAKQVVKRLKRLNISNWDKLAAYWCGRCDGYHLTSKPRRKTGGV